VKRTTNGFILNEKRVMGVNRGWIQRGEVEVNLIYLVRERRAKARDEV